MLVSQYIISRDIISRIRSSMALHLCSVSTDLYHSRLLIFNADVNVSEESWIPQRMGVLSPQFGGRGGHRELEMGHLSE